MIISLDTETTGCDFAHGAEPFLVTTCDEGGVIRFWEWAVNPLTRTPDIPASDLADIAELIDAVDLIYIQNSKFDARALATVGISLLWPKVRDTLTMGHLLASNHKHTLTWMCAEYLGVDIDPYEQHVRKVTRECRSIAKRDYPDWLLADEGILSMPSVKASSKRDEDRPWKNDMWLPRALAKELGDGAALFDPDWLDTCSRYANSDSEHTLYLGLEMERLIRERGYWAIYEHRLQLNEVACEMECQGVTAIGEHTEATILQYQEHIAEAGEALQTIAAGYGYNLELAEGAAMNDNMRDFLYGSVVQFCPRCTYAKRVKHWNGEEQAPRLQAATCPKCAKPSRNLPGVQHELVTTRRDNLRLPVIFSKKGRGSGNATLDKDAMTEYLTTLEWGPALDFIRILTDKRKHDTDLSYMDAYRRFWVPEPSAPGYYQIHPFLNPCATDHLRWASNSPNLQNVSVQEEECDKCDGGGCSLCGGTGKSRLSVRACFGPKPDREWWDFDFRNLEKRIPVYECMEPSLVEVFERPDDPPYWGSDHNVLASLLFPDEYFAINTDPKIGPNVGLHLIKDGFKKKHLTKYKRVKNTNFAKQYGAGKRKVDITAGLSGAFELIERGLPEIAKLQAYYLLQAERTGWVQTLPDRTVDPERGYPILASRTDDGRVLSTTPFNYHVSGTACWVKNTALIRCARQCAEWQAEGFDAHLILEVHDSILFDFPRGRTPEENLPRASVIKGLMEWSGENLTPRIPTPVSLSYYTESWAEETPYASI